MREPGSHTAALPSRRSCPLGRGHTPLLSPAPTSPPPAPGSVPPGWAGHPERGRSAGTAHRAALTSLLRRGERRPDGGGSVLLRSSRRGRAARVPRRPARRRLLLLPCRAPALPLRAAELPVPASPPARRSSREAAGSPGRPPLHTPR